MARSACDLTNRSAPAKLSPAPGSGSAGALVELTRALPAGVNGASTWRIVELWSTDGLPWQATVEWSGGAAGLRRARVLVPQATRVCVNANTVVVSGASLATASENNVWVAIEDGYGQYQNQWVDPGSAPAAGTVALPPPPPFAQHVRLELSDTGLYAGSYLELYDAAGTLRARYRADQQPHPGVPLGDAVKLQTVLSGACTFRASYLLGL